MTKQIDSTWIFDSFADYYDADSPAVQRNIARLADLEGEAFDQATYSIGAGVFRHASSLADDVLPKAGATFADHLYRFGCNTETWDDAAEAYVRAVWGTFFTYLSERGFRIRYVVENTWPDGLERPLELFPSLYRAAGIVYLCPHVVALDLPEGQEAPRTLQGLRPMIAASRLVAATVAEAVNETGRGHICFLEADFDEGSLDAVRGMTPEPGTIEIFRNQPPLPGTKIELRINRAQHVPNGTAGTDSSANVGAGGAGKGL